MTGSLQFSQGLLPALHSPISKVLAPLHSKPQDSTPLPLLKQHVPLEPINQSPLWARIQLKRERLSWGSSSKGHSITKAGSEDSRSSSSSSQSSITLEDDDIGRDVHETSHQDRNLKFFWNGQQLHHSKNLKSTEADLAVETGVHFKVQSRTGYVPTVHRSTDNRDVHLISHTHHLPHTEKVMRSNCEVNNTNCTTKSVHSACSKTFTYVQKGDAVTRKTFVNNEMTDTSTCSEENSKASCATEYETEVNCGATSDIKDVYGHSVPYPTGDYKNEKLQVRRTARTKYASCEDETKVDKPTACCTINANLNTSTAVGKMSIDPKQGKNISKSLKPALSNEKKTDMNCTKSKNNLKSSATSSKKVCDEPQNNQDKLNNRTQQHLLARELKSAHTLRKPCLSGETVRSKSAVEFIAYRDLFQQMQNVDEGPAIYEMFAGPIFDNIRVSRSSEEVKERKFGSGTTKKIKHRPLKPVQNKRSPAETTAVSGKSKSKPVPSRIKSLLTIVPKNGIDGTGSSPKIRTESLSVNDADATSNCAQDKSEIHILTRGEETLSRHQPETLKSNDKSLIAQKPSCQVESYHCKRGITLHTSMGNSAKHVPDPAALPSPPQPKINTWTSSSSSCHSILSPVYQKFLDEAGDGPLTDDLLQCLAEELISLDEKDVSTDSENPEHNKKEFNREKDTIPGQNISFEVNPV